MANSKVNHIKKLSASSKTKFSFHQMIANLSMKAARSSGSVLFIPSNVLPANETDFKWYKCIRPATPLPNCSLTLQMDKSCNACNLCHSVNIHQRNLIKLIIQPKNLHARQPCQQWCMLQHIITALHKANAQILKRYEMWQPLQISNTIRHLACAQVQRLQLCWQPKHHRHVHGPIHLTIVALPVSIQQGKVRQSRTCQPAPFWCYERLEPIARTYSYKTCCNFIQCASKLLRIGLQQRWSRL